MSTPAAALPTAPHDVARALVARARELQREGRTAEAIAAFDAAVAASPADAVAQLAAGTANLQLGRFARGVAHLRVAVAADPALADAWANLAHGFREMGRLEPAREAVERALALDAKIAAAWNLRGIVAQDLGDIEGAQPFFRRALELDPRFALAQVNLANGEQTLGRIESAEREYRRAMEIDPNLPELHYNLAHLYHKSGRERKGIELYRRALALRPDYHLARNNLGHSLFLLGDFAAAWREYGARPNRIEHLQRLSAAGRAYRLPEPAAIAGRRIVVLAEQGLGDILFFLRFVPALRARGASFEFAGEPRLHGMLARTGLFGRLLAAADAGPGIDEVLAGDLALLQDDPATVEPPLPLRPDAPRLASMEARLRALGPRPWIAVAWRAGIARLQLVETLYKDVPVEALGTALRGVDGTFLSVQREPAAGEREALERAAGRPVHDLSRVNEDLEEALALMAAVDDYVGVSSTNVHLRAGCGATGRILVPAPPEWRWMASGPSPWFPGFTSYRQERDAGWQPALDTLSRDLHAARGT